ncbi:MAG: GGDEF domain-containing protein [Gammaproteobacteria bacterium]|nr:GGDEF domain-containing protein [Gammaproteobacteria bacterium]
MVLKEILDSLPVSIYRVDCIGQITYVNEVMRKQLGLPLDDIIGKTAYDFHPDELAKKYQSDDIKVIESKEVFVTVEEHWRESENKMTYVEVIKQPLFDDSGECIGIQGLYSDVTGIREQLIDAEHRAKTDPLTNLPNRKAIDIQLNHYFEKSLRNNFCFGLAFLDLDDFKKINDVNGHIAGDEVLVELSKRLLHLTRGNDWVGRYAGDEFVIIFENMSDRKTFTEWYQRAKLTLSKPVKLKSTGNEILVNLSIGVCLCPQSHLKSVDSLLNEADKMMYKAKADSNQTFYLSGY